jgi:hypothetical protein
MIPGGFTPRPRRWEYGEHLDWGEDTDTPTCDDSDMEDDGEQ